MQTIYQTILEQLAQNQPVALLTVVASTGPTPRKAGTQMVMTQQGYLTGTVGGGSVEYTCQQWALNCLKTHVSGLKTLAVVQNKTNRSPDGKVSIMCAYLDPQVPELQQVLKQAQVGPGWLMIALLGQQAALGYQSSQSGLFVGSPVPSESQIDSPLFVHDETACYFVQPLSVRPRLILFGAGHVAKALVPLLAQLNFNVLVCDDRPEWLNRTNFPDADTLELVDFKQLPLAEALTADDYAVVMTRSHEIDLQLERQLLTTPACYIGVIGSQRKIAQHKAQLKKWGFSLSAIQRMHWPIGLDIGAQSPFEVAVSVAAELIHKRHTLSQHSNSKSSFQK